MNKTENLAFLRPLNKRINTFDRVITRPENTLTVLVIRFVLMSGMVVGFSWWSLQLSP